MFHTENKILNDSHGFKLKDRVKTVCKIYAGLQKNQKTRLTPIPCESVGQIRSIEQIKVDNHYAITYYLVLFHIDQGLNKHGGKKKPLCFWAKLNESCFVKYG